jgi:ribose transport system permease protein
MSDRQPARRLRKLTPTHLASVHSLLLLTVALIVVFSLLEPATFATLFNARSILSSQSVTAMLALAEMIPLAAGEFDLSVGYAMGLIAVITVGLQVNLGLPWELAVVLALLCGMAIGLVNGCLVAFARINSFIATLATGTILYGISNWYTSGVEIEGKLPQGFATISQGRVWEIPIPALYVAVTAVVLWILFEYLPIGRHLYAIGANRKAAELVGIRSRRYVVSSFVAAGFLVGLAGVMTASLLEVGNPNLGPEYLLPAFVGALLGATSVRPGRVNVWGTIIAVILLAVGISGLEHLGAPFFVGSIFNGGTLVIATGLAGYAARRRLKVRTGDPAATPSPPTDPVFEGSHAEHL